MDQHLTLALYRLVLAGHLPASALTERAHRHLVSFCSACGLEWNVDQADTKAGPVPVPALESLHPLDPVASDDRHVGFRDLEERIRLQMRRTRQRQRATRQLNVLLAADSDSRTKLIEEGNGRFKGRALAELLILRSREHVHDDPVEAQNLLSLVPVVLRWTPKTSGKGWAATLRLRAWAWNANAVRVKGDLAEADRLFRELRRHPDLSHVKSPGFHAEVASLEASLRIAQRKFDEAETLLSGASALYRQDADAEGQLRVIVSKSNLLRSCGSPDRALQTLSAGTELLTGISDPLLSAVFIVARAGTLCDLERYEEADALLRDHQDLTTVAKDKRRAAAAIYYLEGRIALGCGDASTAETRFSECRRLYLETRRSHEAALISLEIAQLYLDSGRVAELESLAADLVPQFKARGATGETLAALRLLAEAVKARAVTNDLLQELRQRVRPGPGHPPLR